MFPLYPFNPFIPIGQRNQIKLIDVGGIYELKTNAQQVTDASVDYGINPCYYNALPCECIVLLKDTSRSCRCKCDTSCYNRNSK